MVSPPFFRGELTVSFREGPPTAHRAVGENPPQGRRSHPLGHGSRSGVSWRFLFCFGENMENAVLGCFFKQWVCLFFGFILILYQWSTRISESGR